MRSKKTHLPNLSEKNIIKLANKIQKFLDSCQYNHRDYARSAARVEKDKIAHCLEGALYAAWKLSLKGIKPYLLDFRAIADDDHVVCLYRVGTYWGSIGKSSTSLLSGRPAIFSSIQALVNSYASVYFNRRGKLSLNKWSGPVPMEKFKSVDWIYGQKNMQLLAYEMDKIPGKEIISKAKLKKLPKVSKSLFKACYAQI